MSAFLYTCKQTLCVCLCSSEFCGYKRNMTGECVSYQFLLLEPEQLLFFLSLSVVSRSAQIDSLIDLFLFSALPVSCSSVPSTNHRRPLNCCPLHRLIAIDHIIFMISSESHFTLKPIYRFKPFTARLSFSLSRAHAQIKTIDSQRLSSSSSLYSNPFPPFHSFFSTHD